ncbi:hypothetical protein V5O48_013185 [Marasmius crinis-equi]|uniref:Uncharacterized protein n=1 Tax=Marasmius crinis-equi TaxID=585013 RepID=A0ABR3F0T6_9AGAR
MSKRLVLTHVSIAKIFHAFPFSTPDILDSPASRTYQKYLIGNREGGKFCSPNVNQTLPSNIQEEACEKGIKTIGAAYNTFWSDGAWFYNYYSQEASKGIKSLGDRAFTKCPSNSTSKASTPTSNTLSPTSTIIRSDSQDDPGRKGLSTGAIAGISAGAAVALAIAVIFFCLRRKRRRNDRKPEGHHIEPYFQQVPNTPSFSPTPTPIIPTRFREPKSPVANSSSGSQSPVPHPSRKDSGWRQSSDGPSNGSVRTTTPLMGGSTSNGVYERGIRHALGASDELPPPPSYGEVVGNPGPGPSHRFW